MSRKTVFLNCLLILICCASLIVPASAQHFKQVKGTLTHVAAGRNEIFGIDSSSAVWRYNASTKSFAEITGASLVSVAVGGGTRSQLDEVWGLDGGNIYRFNYSTNTFDQVGGILAQITVGEGTQDNCHPYEVWGLNQAQGIFRYDYCTNQFVQTPSGILAEVATGGGDVWGINSQNNVFHYDFANQSFEPVPGTMVQIAVGVNDVWAINASNKVFRYNPGTQKFVSVAGTLSQIAVGGDGVWGVAPNHNTFRFDPATGGFVRFSILFSNVAVGCGAGVFGVNPGDNVYTFVRP